MKIKGILFHPLIVVLAAIMLSGFIFNRIGYLNIPLDRDEGSYLYMGYCFVKGYIPYVDFYEMKPPGIFFTYGIFHLLFGYSLTTLHLGLLLVQLSTAITIYQIVYRLANNSNAAILSALGYLLLLMYPNFMGFAIVSEQFFVLYILISLVLLLKPSKTNQRVILAGVFLGLAAMTRQHAIFFIAPLAYCLIFLLPNKRVKKSVLSFSLGSMFVIALFGIYILIRGGWSEMIYWVWTYPSESYISQLSWKEGKIYFYNYLSNHFISKFWPLMVIFVMALLVIIKNIIKGKERHTSIFAALFFTASLGCVFPGFKFYGHYWLMFFPGICIFLGYSYVDFSNKKLEVAIPIIVFVLFIAQLFQNKFLYFLVEPQVIYQKLYGSNPNFALDKVTDYLVRKLEKNDEIYVFGSEPQVYYQSKKVSKIPHVYVGFLHSENKRMAGYQRETINYLEKEKPKYIVHIQNANSIFMGENSTRDLYNWIFNFESNNYSPIMMTEIHDEGKPSYYYDKDAAKSPLTKSYIILYKINR